MSNIVLYVPVHAEPELVRRMVRHHRKLVGIAEIVYYDDNTNERSSEILKHSGATILPRIEMPDMGAYQGHDWSSVERILRITAIRNKGAQYVMDEGADALFIVDADVFCHPYLPGHLESLGKDIVSEVYWTRWKPESLWMPQVWDFGQYAYRSADRIIALREPGVVEVGGLGACTLIRREALRAGLNWNPVPTLFGVLGGEDRHFCVRAQVLGFKLWADTAMPPFHLYRDEMLPELERWLGTGCSPTYFRENWLTDEWANEIRKLYSPTRTA